MYMILRYFNTFRPMMGGMPMGVMPAAIGPTGCGISHTARREMDCEIIFLFSFFCTCCFRNANAKLGLPPSSWWLCAWVHADAGAVTTHARSRADPVHSPKFSVRRFPGSSGVTDGPTTTLLERRGFDAFTTTWCSSSPGVRAHPAFIALFLVSLHLPVWFGYVAKHSVVNADKRRGEPSSKLP